VELFDSKRKSASKEYLPKIGIQGQYIGPEDRFGTRTSGTQGWNNMRSSMGSPQGRRSARQKFNSTGEAQKSLLESALVVQIDRLNTDLTEFRKGWHLQDGGHGGQERAQLAADGYAWGVRSMTNFSCAKERARSEIRLSPEPLSLLSNKGRARICFGAPR